MEVGQVVCLKTTGEIVILLTKNITEEKWLLRRPVMTSENGINQTIGEFYTFELETIEEHLRREGKEMILKTKIQNEMMEELANLQKKGAIELVN